jgi:hypothetical protein
MKRYITLIILLSFLTAGCEKMLLGPEPENTAKNNFDILWKTFDENYALFPVKHVNWDSLHIVYSSRISSSTTDSELWNIIAELISHLNDGHVNLFNKGFTKWAGSSEIGKRKADDFSLDLVKNKFLSTVTVVGAGFISYGKIKNKNIGYIDIATFQASNSGNGSDWAYDIDKAVRDLYQCDGLIIDLRNNGGGLKVTGAIIASAFIDREITYFYQREKTGPGHDDFGGPIPLTVTPRKDVLRFTKKIALLTNRFSASGSEHFAQVFRYLKYATQIGDTTFGCFGDVLNIAQLPNGWTYRYPCRLTTTPEGTCPEGIGIIPNVLVENTKANIDAGKDNVMEYAIQYLSP